MTWTALPGGCLELSGTGFQIRLVNDPKRKPLELIDPDGRVLVDGYDLLFLKQMAEHYAKDRSEFL